MWLFMILLWLIAPALELAIIVALGIANDRKTREIRRLQTELKKYGWQEGMQKQWEQNTLPMKKGKAGVPEEGKSFRPVQPEMQSMSEERKNLQPAQSSGKEPGGVAMLALLAGVVFVVLAGLIFATTAWRILSNPAKVFLVFTCSLLFFGSSLLAEGRLHIHKTGNALYVLGSIFLFLSVLAAAYFRLLGPEYVLVGQNRWNVLWVGSLLTVFMLFLGIDRFRDGIYTQACFWGLTVTVTFWTLARGMSWFGEWLSVMMLYAFLLVLGKWGLGRLMAGKSSGEKPESKKTETQKQEPERGELLAEGFSWFAPVHFWVFSLPVVFLGTVGGIFQLKGCLYWYVVLAMGAAVLGTVIELKNKREEWKRWFFALATVGTVHGFLTWIGFFLFQGEPAEGMGFLLLSELITALWLLMGERIGFGLDTRAEKRIVLGFLLWDAFLLNFQVLLQQIWGEAYGTEILQRTSLQALAGILVLAAVVAVWQRDSWTARWSLPFLLWYLVSWPLKIWLRCVLPGCLTESGWEMALDWMNRGVVEFLFLTGLIFWEEKKKAGYGVPILILGTGLQLVYFSLEELRFPFFLLLSGYLFSQAWTAREKEDCQRGWRRKESGEAATVKWAKVFRESLWLLRSAAVYAMLGAGLLMSPFTRDNPVLALLGVIGSYGGGMAAEKLLWRAGGEEKERGLFWDIWGCFWAVALILTYYMGIYDGIYDGGNQEMVVLILCLAVFAGFYRMFYLGKRIWPHLILGLAMLPIPLVLAVQYQWSENRLYFIVMAVITLIGLGTGCRHRICEPSEEVCGGWRVDWYPVLAIALLVLMAGMSREENWRFVYLLFLSGYVLQFARIRQWKRLAWSGAGVFLVLAYWNQPWIPLPEEIRVELELLPAAGYLWWLGRVWRKKEATTIEILQTAGYLLCLLILTANAWITQEVVHGLILEGICLAAFVWALVRHCRRWIRMAGTILILVALYMTKSFWLSISWWVYLLAAGIGLILFAAFHERR